MHFGQTYSWFIRSGRLIEVNGIAIEPEDFENWTYPKEFVPKAARFEVNIANEGKVTVEIVVGLIGDRVAEEDNYGAYFYCNHRLIIKDLKSREVGYFIRKKLESLILTHLCVEELLSYKGRLV